MGTPAFAATALTGLVTAGFPAIGVITQPDAKSGRGSKIGASEVKCQAEKHNIPVYQPEDKAELTEVVKKIKPELIVVAAYGMIIPQTVLDIPKYGTLNIHGSILPAYRGASPIAEAILAGDKETGITIMKMSLGMDEGDTISNYRLPITREDTTETLTDKMATLGAKAIVESIPKWISGELKETPQDDSKATYCKKLTKEDGHIDWSKPAGQIERMVRAYTPWPTAYTFARDARIKILKSREIPGLRPGMTDTLGVLSFDDGHIYVGTGGGILEILELQPEGKKPMTARDYINGNKQLDGTKLE